MALGQTPTITIGCLPSAPITGLRCYTAGWGKNDFTNGAFQAIIKEVDVPIVDPNTCQNFLRSTRLGSSFTLDTTSFMCAGGEAGKGKISMKYFYSIYLIIFNKF